MTPIVSLLRQADAKADMRATVRRDPPGRPESKTPAAPAEPAILTLDSRGMIRDCNPAAERLFGYSRKDLAWQYVSLLLPQLVPEQLIQQGVANPRLHFLCHIGRRFHAVARDGADFASELSMNVLGDVANPRIVLIVRPV
ncbi:MAG: PAS domain-containing protein [Rhodocyclaceae bacterium]|jgi:PAS domain S-box-containing protein|nr:PAS domain-containing protein [Rhodocyclaceae bacterium]